MLIVIFRLGCYITIPGVDTFTLAEEMSSATNGVTGLIDTISGGAFSRLSIFAMSITPYITASIVIQLLGMVIPALERLTKEGGEEGRTKINKYTKILTIVLALIEGLGIFFSYKSSGIFLDTSFIGGALTVISLMAGTALLIWLGEQITNKGIGNGISMIIFVGIISGLPRGITAVWGLMFSAGTFSTVGFIKALALIVGLLVLVAGVVFIQIAERRIPVQYAKKVVGIELIEEAAKAANENAKLNGLNNCNFIAGDVAEVIKIVKDKPDIIILDPPRSGVHPNALDYVIKFNAPQIIYVSCNPKTLVTDLKVLEAKGYEIEKTLLMDMFPNTPHVETVVKLNKK